MLPIASLLLLIANLQLLARGGGSGILSVIRNWFQLIATVSLPFYGELPAGA